MTVAASGGAATTARSWASWTVVTATVSTTVAILAPALVGGLGFLMMRDLAFDEARLGGAAAVFFAATALSSVAGGRVAERLGAVRAMQVGALGSAACLAGVASASGWTQLAAWLVVGGVSNGLAQPGSNLALANGVDDLRQGLAFGIKQSAIPVAALLTGLSVPLLALTLGWRPVFVLAAGAAVVLALVAPRFVAPAQTRPAERTPRPDSQLRALVLLAGACCLGTAAALSLSTFLVGYVQSLGVSSAGAGALLAVGAVASITVRLLSGWLADRFVRGALLGVSGALVVGAIGYAGLALSTSGGLPLAVLVALAFGFGWGWPALFSLTVVRLNPTAPAAATGVTQAGGALGGVVGPLAFGAVVVHGSYGVAWWAAAGAATVSAVLMLVSGRSRTRGSRTA